MSIVYDLFKKITRAKDMTLISNKFTPEKVKTVAFPFTPLKNIQENLPLVLEALDSQGILSDEMVYYVLATISVENDKFLPLSETPSKYSDLDGQAPYDFSKYDKMTGLGNTPELDGDGELYKGRGLLQITGRTNYSDMDKKLKLNGKLLNNPNLASTPQMSAAILAQYMKDRESKINSALKNKDFITLRKIVNGGTLHLDKFTEAFLKLEKEFKDS
jgi:putative chitinase